MRMMLDGKVAREQARQAPPRGSWRQARPAVMIAAVATFVPGLVLLAWPRATIAAVAVLIGAALLVTGLFRVVHGFTAARASGTDRAACLLTGLLAGAAGAYCLGHVRGTVIALAFVTGAYWVLHGVTDIIAAITAEPAQRGRGLRAVTGTVSLLAGLILMFWPVISLTILLAVTGGWLICYGLLLGVLAWRLKGEYQ